MMDDYKIERAAIRLMDRYGKGALPKVVELIKMYMASNDTEKAKIWVKIGYIIKEKQQIQSVEQVKNKKIIKKAREKYGVTA